MAFQPKIKLIINRWRGTPTSEDEIQIDNNISIDIDFTESVAPSSNNFKITLYNFAMGKDLNLTEGRDRIKVEMGYQDENDTFVYEGVVSNLSYNHNQQEKQCSFNLIGGDDILNFPVIVNERPRIKPDGTNEKTLSIYAVLVRALASFVGSPKKQGTINKQFIQAKKPILVLQENLQGKPGQLEKIDVNGTLQSITCTYFQFTGSFKGFMDLILLGTGFGYYIYNNGDSRILRLFEKTYIQQNKEKYMAYTLTKDSGLFSYEINQSKGNVVYNVTSIFLPLLRAGMVVKIETKQDEYLYIVVSHIHVTGDNYKSGLLCEFSGVDIQDIPDKKAKNNLKNVSDRF